MLNNKADYLGIQTISLSWANSLPCKEGSLDIQVDSIALQTNCPNVHVSSLYSETSGLQYKKERLSRY